MSYLPPSFALTKDPVRTAVRFPLRLQVSLQTPEGILEAMTENVSASGLLLVARKLPGVDTKVEFTMAMPSAIMGTSTDVKVHCVGRVVRHQQSGTEQKAAVVIDEYSLEAS